jgi:DNA-binding Xre family transcriptional regulator
MLVKRKMSVTELAYKVDITIPNISVFANEPSSPALAANSLSFIQV